VVEEGDGIHLRTGLGGKHGGADREFANCRWLSLGGISIVVERVWIGVDAG